MATKNYLSVNKKIKIQTEEGQSYYLGKPNDINEMDIRTLRSSSGALIFFMPCVAATNKRTHKSCGKRKANVILDVTV